METKLEKHVKGLQKSGDSRKMFANASFKDGLPAPRVIHGATNNSMIAKQADYGMMGNTTQQPTFWYSPELTPDSWLLPKSRIETLRFCKIYYNLDPYIHSILNMHAQYGFSRFKLQYKDPKYTKLFNTLLFHNQEFDWYQFTLDIALSYYKYGEAVCWGSWNSARRTWDRFTLIDPALVEYKEDLFTGHATIELIPTVEMKQTVKEAIMQGRTDIDPMLLDAVQNNKKLPLDTEGTPENVFTGQKYSPAKVFVFARRTDVSSTRGTSIIQSLFRDMIYKDQLRMSQIAVAQKTQLPIELWTVGHLGNDEQSSILPGPEMLDEVRNMITNATQQPPYSIVYGPYLKYEALGVSGKLLDIYNDLGYVENQILVGLGVNKAVVLGEGPNVQGKAISLNRLIREYATVRDLFANFMKIHVLLPIAKANNLLDEEGQYIVPEIVWELSLQPEQDKEKFDMCYKMWKDGLISTMSLYEKCPEKFDYILEMKRLEDERGSIFDKGDRRLGRTQGGGTVSGGAAPKTTGGNVRDGKGNPDLRDFALGGNNASTINDAPSSATDVGDGANAPAGGADNQGA